MGFLFQHHPIRWLYVAIAAILAVIVSSYVHRLLNPWTVCSSAASVYSMNQYSMEETPLQAGLSFPGGQAKLELYDTEAALEVAERRPFVVQLQHQGNRLVLPGLPATVFQRESNKGMNPVAGDVAFDTAKNELVVFLADEAASDDLIPLGHVSQGLDNMKHAGEVFQTYVTQFEPSKAK